MYLLLLLEICENYFTWYRLCITQGISSKLIGSRLGSRHGSCDRLENFNSGIISKPLLSMES